MGHFSDYQDVAHLRTLQGVLPRLAVDFWTPEANDGGNDDVGAQLSTGWGGDNTTQNGNGAAFSQWGITPQMMSYYFRGEMSTALLGMRSPSPLITVPDGVTGFCTRNGHGKLAAALTQIPLVASTLSDDPLEAVAKTLGDMPGFSSFTPQGQGAGGNRRAPRRSDRYKKPQQVLFVTAPGFNN